jgi:hypothetical protein
VQQLLVTEHFRGFAEQPTAFNVVAEGVVVGKHLPRIVEEVVKWCVRESRTFSRNRRIISRRRMASNGSFQAR